MTRDIYQWKKKRNIALPLDIGELRLTNRIYEIISDEYHQVQYARSLARTASEQEWLKDRMDGDLSIVEEEIYGFISKTITSAIR